MSVAKPLVESDHQLLQSVAKYVKETFGAELKEVRPLGKGILNLDFTIAGEKFNLRLIRWSD